MDRAFLISLLFWFHTVVWTLRAVVGDNSDPQAWR